jgi:hypothetical protein
MCVCSLLGLRRNLICHGEMKKVNRKWEYSEEENILKRERKEVRRE